MTWGTLGLTQNGPQNRLSLGHPTAELSYYWVAPGRSRGIPRMDPKTDCLWVAPRSPLDLTGQSHLYKGCTVQWIDR